MRNSTKVRWAVTTLFATLSVLQAIVLARHQSLNNVLYVAWNVACTYFFSPVKFPLPSWLSMRSLIAWGERDKLFSKPAETKGIE